MKVLNSKVVPMLALLSLTSCAVYVHDRPGFGHRTHVVGVSGPRLVLVAGTSIKYCPDEDEDIFFYGGRWYIFRGGVWLYGARHTGPWKAVRRGGLPRAFVNVPPGHFRHHKGSWHPARDHHPGLGKGHDKDGDGDDDHKGNKGKGHRKH